MQAAGLAIISPQGILFLKRSADSSNPGTWCFPGGGSEEDEDPKTTAIRETREETGFISNGEPKIVSVTKYKGTTYTTLKITIDDQFVPTLDNENVAWAWASIDNPPEPLHPGVNTILEKLRNKHMAQDGWNVIEYAFDVAWEESKHPRGQPGNPGQFGYGESSYKKETVVYHGTIDSILDSVKKSGLTFIGHKRNFTLDKYEGERGESIYISNNINEAKEWAYLGARNQNSDADGLIIFEIHIPPDQEINLKHDEVSQGEFRFFGNIPPEWIKRYSSTTLKNFLSVNPKPWSNFKKFAQDSENILYALIPCFNKETHAALDAFVESQHPRGQPKNKGQFAKGQGSSAGGNNEQQKSPPSGQGEKAPIQASYTPEEEQQRIAEAEKISKSIPETHTINTPERQALRKHIEDTLYNTNIESRKRNREATIILGLPASGKSTLANPLLADGNLEVDPDLAKAMLPEYRNGLGASATHEESSAITKNILKRALANGDNFVWPRVNSPDKIVKDMQNLKSLGYKVNVRYLHVDPAVAKKSAISRFMKTGRYVPFSVIDEFGDAPRQSYEMAKPYAYSAKWHKRDESGISEAMDQNQVAKRDDGGKRYRDLVEAGENHLSQAIEDLKLIGSPDVHDELPSMALRDQAMWEDLTDKLLMKHSHDQAPMATIAPNSSMPMGGKIVEDDYGNEFASDYDPNEPRDKNGRWAGGTGEYKSLAVTMQTYGSGVKGGKVATFEVMVNPSMNKIEGLMKDEGTVRLMRLNGHVFVWGASYVTHSTMSKYFGFDPFAPKTTKKQQEEFYNNTDQLMRKNGKIVSERGHQVDSWGTKHKPAHDSWDALDGAMDEAFLGLGRSPWLAMDFQSVRSYDDDGRLHVAQTNISKSAVNPYLGREIPGWEKLNLDPNKMYNLLRDPKELEDAAPTFNNLPLLASHIPVTADDHQPSLIIGSTGSNAVFEYPFLKNSLVVWARNGIEDIENEKKKELSAAYRYDPVMKPGIFEGQRYDGIMTNIRGNHVAVVESGRAGPSVYVADSGDESGWKMLESILENIGVVYH